MIGLTVEAKVKWLRRRAHSLENYAYVLERQGRQPEAAEYRQACSYHRQVARRLAAEHRQAARPHRVRRGAP